MTASVSLQSALELVQRAVSLDNSGKAQEAISMYTIAIEQLRQVSFTTHESSTKNLIESKILEYQNRSNFLKSSLHLDYNNNNNSNTLPSFPLTPQTNNNSSNVNGGGNLLDQALKYANEAIACESNNNIQNAINYYKKCAELLEQVAKNENNIETRLFLNQKRQEYQSRGESLELTVNNSNSLSNSLNLSNGISSINNSSNNNNNNNILSNSNNLPFPQVENESYSIINYNQIELSNNSTEFIDMAINYATEAIKEDDHLNYEKAIHYYDLSVQYFQTALQYETNQQIRQLISQKMVNSQTRSQFLKNKIQYKQNLTNNEYDSVPLSLKPGQKYKDPVRKKTVLEKLVKTIKGPQNISDHWL